MADVYSEGYGSTTGLEPGLRRARPEVAEEGAGWVTFAGIMLAIIGVLNVIYGIAAISNSHFYIRDTSYVVSGLNGWGWALLIVGIIQFFAAFSIWAGSEWGRWAGLATASVNSIIQLMILPAAPFSSLALFAVDVLIIYGLAAHGGRQAA
jgi:hypothetical protein